ncbi:MAG: insulinase family protein [candidate division KSB1 bacterium]|nr:insulinase family protein [candidate division KSB1 bacterium]MDZ7301101.1 insulinase family protein [candidate division KSB1 bacterium]MDZ7312014.1 insulinase family protein [candidate division KSB1 bacterium]
MQKFLYGFFSVLFLFGITSTSLGSEPPLSPRPDGAVKMIILDSPSPLVQLKIMIKAGSAYDPVGYEGLAYLTARLLLEGSYGDPQAPVTKEKLAEITRPWGSAAKPSVSVEKEVTTFSMTVPREVFKSFNAQVLTPLFNRPLFVASELDRIRQETLEYVGSSLRFEDVEMLGLLALDNYIHEGTTYGHFVQGSVQGLKAVTTEQVRRFYGTYYRPENLIVGLSTKNPQINQQVQAALKNIGGAIGSTPLEKSTIDPPSLVKGRQLVIIAHPNTIASGLHAGFPIALKRGDKDYWALYVANVFLGTHRDSFGRLYNDFRQARGYNYGDYSYIEWFANRPYHLFPPTNTPRRYQYFSIWIRPVALQYAHHLLKAMTWQLENFIRTGMTPEECELAKNKAKALYLNLAETSSRLLAYKLDDAFYGMEDRGYLDTYLKSIDALTPEEINAAIKKYLQVDNLKYVIVTNKDWAERLRDDIANNRNAAGKNFKEYNIEFRAVNGDTLWQFPKSKMDLVQMDKVWEEYWLNLAPENIRVVKAEQVFEDGRFVAE